ncbi:hypothetical protein D3C71_1546460 [compost metagenome]
MRKIRILKFTAQFIVEVKWEYDVRTGDVHKIVISDYSEMTQWCQENIGKVKEDWNVCPGALDANFVFFKLSNAMLFKLRFA